MCLKAVVQCAPQPDETAVVIGQGPIGLLFTMPESRNAQRSRFDFFGFCTLSVGLAALQLIAVLDGMARLVAEDGHAFGPGAALDVEHHFLLELHQAGMGEIERDGNARRLVRTEPFARDPGVGTQPNAPLFKLFVKSFDAVLEPRAFDRNLQTAEAPLEQLLIRQRLPSVFPARHRVSDTGAVRHRDGVMGR